MIRLALLLTLLAMATCGIERLNGDGTGPFVELVNRSLIGGNDGEFDPATFRIRIANDLSQGQTVDTTMHEYTHAIEAAGRTPARDVLRLYSTPAFPSARGDLSLIPPPKLLH